MHVRFKVSKRVFCLVLVFVFVGATTEGIPSPIRYMRELKLKRRGVLGAGLVAPTGLGAEKIHRYIEKFGLFLWYPNVKMSLAVRLDSRGVPRRTSVSFRTVGLDFISFFSSRKPPLTALAEGLSSGIARRLTKINKPPH